MSGHRLRFRLDAWRKTAGSALFLSNVLLTFSAPVCNASDSAPSVMRFDLRPPMQPSGIVGNSWTIFASGVIDVGAAARFQNLIATHHISSGSYVAFNSPGGSILEAMNLGREIRVAGLQTYIHRLGVGKMSELPGECYSACALAFLGGQFRYIDDPSVYGVHRFYLSEKQPDEFSLAQILSSYVVHYIREMGADTELFNIMTKAGKDEVVVIPHDRLESLDVVNNGAEKPVWTLESIPSGLYLKGQQSTFNGVNKLAFFCAGSARLGLDALFENRGRWPAVQTQNARALLLDDQVIKIPTERTGGPALVKDTINVWAFLNSDEVGMLFRAHKIGFSLQNSYRDNTFIGIYPMDFEDGLTKLDGLLATCKQIEPKRSDNSERNAHEQAQDRGDATNITRLLSAATRAEIGRETRLCYSKDLANPAYSAFSITVSVTVDSTGTARIVQLSHADQTRTENDAGFHNFASLAEQAILDPKCARLSLPPEMLGQPHTLTFRFRP
jgi:hypothetical protein